MRILLVNPSAVADTAGSYSDSMLPMPPLGIAYLAAVARTAGHTVFVEDQYASKIGANRIAEMVEENKIDFLGISCLSPNMPMVEKIVERVRANEREVHICLGNVHATYFAGEILANLPIDSIVLGEGEQTLAELLEKLASGKSLAQVAGLAYKKAGRVKFNQPRPPIADLEKLPQPIWDPLRIDDYFAPPRLLFKDRVLAVQASRGCPYNCSFCAQNLFSPKIRRRKLESLVDEIEHMVSEYGVTCFGFQDAMFPLTEKEGFEFCRLLRERKLHDKIRWFTETRYDAIGYELLREFKRHGCLYIMYGVESASARLLKEAGKNLDPARAIETMRNMKRAKIVSYGLFMIGFPGETEKEARQTIAFAKKLDCDVASFGRVTPYPGTRLYEEYKHLFPTDVEPWHWNNQYRPGRGEETWQLPGLTAEQITRLIGKAMTNYYIRPKMIYRHLRLGTFSPMEMLTGAYYLAKDRLSG